MAGLKKQEGIASGIFEINLTPLIDVSLVLVVILLLATPLAFESSIAVRKSAESALAAEESSDDERIELRVFSEDSVRVNRTAVARRRLGEALRPIIESNPQALVTVACGDAVSHGAFVDVLDRAKVCGAAEIAIVGK
jgi:biopolymer transport protein ExbD